LACRDEKKASEAAKDIISKTGSDKVIVGVLDLASFESVRAFAKLINETEERVDILVNNAGVGPGPLQITKDGYESIFQVNYLSHFLLTLLLLEKIKKSAPSRIVNVSTNAHTFPFLKVRLDDFKPTEESFNSYTRCFESKLAQVVFTKELSRRLEGKEGSQSLAGHIVSLDKELYSTLSLFTQVHKWVPVTYCWGVTLRWTGLSLRFQVSGYLLLVAAEVASSHGLLKNKSMIRLKQA